MSLRSASTKQLLGFGLLGAGLAAMVGIGLQLGPASGQDKNPDPVPVTADTQLDTVPVERSDLSEIKEAVGTVSYGETWSAPIEATGVITKRNDRGTIVEHGEPLIWINNLPVTLAAGETPMYRTLELIPGGKSKLLKGDDVQQLQEFLLSRGFDDKERLTADGQFGLSTKRAVIEWQKDLGRSQTGTVDRGQLVFHSSALRIDSAPRVGANYEGLSLTESSQRITAGFDTKSRAFLTIGATVTLDLGDGQSAEGTISEVTSTVGDDGTRRLNVIIEPDGALSGDVERTTVITVRQVASDVLVLPVRAIVALAGGGYAVEIVDGGQPTLTRVELGAVVDDRVEISGEIEEGDQVIVPTDILSEGL